MIRVYLIVFYFFVNSSLKIDCLSLTRLGQQEKLLLIQSSKTVKSIVYTVFCISLVDSFIFHTFI